MLGLFLLAAYASAANQTVVDQTKDEFKDAYWSKHVTDWDPKTSVIEIKTDYDITKVGSYKAGFAICQAITSNFAKGADDKPDIQVYGVSTTTKTKVDGSRETDTDDKQVIAQSVLIGGFKCGINPPFGDPVYKQAEKLGVKIHS
jgi:hypothetical protein